VSKENTNNELYTCYVAHFLYSEDWSPNSSSALGSQHIETA